MNYQTIEEIIKKAQTASKPKILAVAGAGEEHTLEAVLKAERDGIVRAILIGNVIAIKEILKKYDANVSDYEIVDGSENPADIAVQLVREEKADILMKGNVQTGDLIRPILNKERGIMKGELLSHVLFVQAPAYKKIFLVTDSAIVPNPDLKQKIAILQNAVNTMNALGYIKPKVAVLAAVEVVNPKMQETVDADEIKRICEETGTPDCIVAGPISMDIAFDAEAGGIKGFDSPVAGNPDILLMPNLLTGNIAVKTLRVFGQSTIAGLVVGASSSIVLTSRSTSAMGKYQSIALGAAIATGT